MNPISSVTIPTTEYNALRAAADDNEVKKEYRKLLKKQSAQFTKHLKLEDEIESWKRVSHQAMRRCSEHRSTIEKLQKKNWLQLIRWHITNSKKDHS